jgi:phosphohistidine phosphatase
MTVHTLLLLRHAKSSWDDSGLADHERPLAPRGRRAAKLIAEHMRSTGVEPELVLCSSAVRARETLDLVRPALPSSAVSIEDELYAASAEELLTRIRRVSDTVGSVLVVGHNPDLQQLALLLASRGDGLERLEAKFPTAALATLTFAATWSRVAPGGASLDAYVVPRQLS